LPTTSERKIKRKSKRGRFKYQLGIGKRKYICRQGYSIGGERREETNSEQINIQENLIEEQNVTGSRAGISLQNRQKNRDGIRGDRAKQLGGKGYAATVKEVLNKEKRSGMLRRTKDVENLLQREKKVVSMTFFQGEVS